MSRVRSFVWVGLGGVAVGLVTIIPLLFAWGDFHDLLKPLRDSGVLGGVLDRNLLGALFFAGVCCLAFLVVFFLVTAGICVKGRIVATSAEVLGGVLGVISGARVVRLVRRISGAKPADER